MLTGRFIFFLTFALIQIKRLRMLGVASHLPTRHDSNDLFSYIILTVTGNILTILKWMSMN